MFGFRRRTDLARAEKILTKETGIRLRKIPGRRSVEDLFVNMSAQGKLSSEAQIALLYRLVAISYLGACKLMRDGGENTPPEELAWVTTLTDLSVVTCRLSSDHFSLKKWLLLG